MKTLVFLAAVGFAAYWFVLRGGCGTKGAIACPPAALEEGVGTTLDADEVCRRAGYLCVERGQSFQVMRWQLDQGKLRVRMTLPDFVDEATAQQVRAAAIEGIMEWDRHPFPLVIDAGKYTWHFWDVDVVWTQGLFNESAGLARSRGDINGKRFEYSIDSIAVVVPPIAPDGPPHIQSADPAIVEAQMKAMAFGMNEDAALAQVKAIAMHEMGHALGLMHSDRESDIMYPRYRAGVTPDRISARDLQTVEALYALPNGATIQ